MDKTLWLTFSWATLYVYAIHLATFLHFRNC